MERFPADQAESRRPSTPPSIGPYLLKSAIARGDLTTVHLAMKQGALGFQRLYALRIPKPGVARHDAWVQLFLDQARLLSSIQHANIAAVLEVGSDAGGFVAMEYIEGENLELLLARAGARRDPRYVAPPLVDTLHALHALHTAVDELRLPWAIVHGAPSARHVVVGLDGVARLVDFTQARRQDARDESYPSGRLRAAYMTPQQVREPERVDLRDDLFIVGITLWEALTGESLFAAADEEQTFENVLQRPIPAPSEVGLKPPPCFDAICLRALDRDPDKRFGSALEMARALRDTALNHGLYATPAELGSWVRELAGDELRERRRALSVAPAAAVEHWPLAASAGGELPWPNQAAPSLPPATQRMPRGALWVTSGMLVAAVLLAVGVGIRKRLAGEPSERQSHRAAAAVISPPARFDERRAATTPTAPPLAAKPVEVADPQIPARTPEKRRAASSANTAPSARLAPSRAPEDARFDARPGPSRLPAQPAARVSPGRAPAVAAPAADPLPDNPY